MRACFLAALCLLPGSLGAQANLNFSSGLAGWTVPAKASSAGYWAETRREACHSTACVVLLAPDSPPAGSIGNLDQSFDATPYRGKDVRLRAWLRVEGSDSAASGQLWMRVALPDTRLGFFDTMGDRPVKSRRWLLCEINGEVAPDATVITLGILTHGKGRVWVDSVSFEAMPISMSPRIVADRAGIRALYARVDAAYGSGDVDAIASLALPEARIMIGGQNLPLADVLAPVMDEVRKGMKFRSESTVTAIRIENDTATVFVNNFATRTHAAAARSVASSNRDIWVRTVSGWRLKESSLIDTHEVDVR